MKLSASQLAQRVLDEQGYLVIGAWDRHKIGDVRPVLMAPGTKEGELKHPVVIIGISTHEEYLEQHRRFAPKGIRAPTGIVPYYYRAIAE
jgi:hypothetical protein